MGEKDDDDDEGVRRKKSNDKLVTRVGVGWHRHALMRKKNSALG
jgi:hypothetical protein